MAVLLRFFGGLDTRDRLFVPGFFGLAHQPGQGQLQLDQLTQQAQLGQLISQAVQSAFVHQRGDRGHTTTFNSPKMPRRGSMTANSHSLYVG